MNVNTVVISILLALTLVGGVILFAQESRRPDRIDSSAANNTSVIDGTQIITISAKGGYWPQVTRAKAGIPTVLKVATRGTFDCSSVLLIPSLDINKNLPPSGETEIVVPAQEPGATLRGLCGMGMYNFNIQFD